MCSGGDRLGGREDPNGGGCGVYTNDKSNSGH